MSLFTPLFGRLFIARFLSLARASCNYFFRDIIALGTLLSYGFTVACEDTLQLGAVSDGNVGSYILILLFPYPILIILYCRVCEDEWNKVMDTLLYVSHRDRFY